MGLEAIFACDRQVAFFQREDQVAWFFYAEFLKIV